MKLKKSFYEQDTEAVARKLLGKKLVHIYRGSKLSGIITETEAYLGIHDKACHTYGGRKTQKTQAMYLNGGHAYIYFIYGMYNCFNVVTRTKDHPEAVLIRSLRPLEGINKMIRLRGTNKVNNLTTGPGKLAQALHLSKNQNGLSLCSRTLYIEDAPDLPTTEIISKPRIGIDYAEEAKYWPLRFYIKGSDFISKK